jgi:hypothetical protein
MLTSWAQQQIAPMVELASRKQPPVIDSRKNRGGTDVSGQDMQPGGGDSVAQ